MVCQTGFEAISFAGAMPVSTIFVPRISARRVSLGDRLSTPGSAEVTMRSTNSSGMVGASMSAV